MCWLLILSLVMSIVLSSFQEASAGICKSRGTAQPIKRSIGETVQFLCPHFGCGGSTYNFTHYNTAGEADLIHQGSHTYSWTISSLSDAGDYCCSKQCDVDQRQCCITVEVPPVIEWTLPEAVVENTSVTGSCRATGYPRPSVGVINTCNYQYQYNVIDEYTSEVVFTIKSITKKCQHIYCYTSSSVDTRKVLLAENVSCVNDKDTSAAVV
ncbi:uncharacterized protein [Dysidea avara]|uniref:uncharacterized protein isoform X2 n=1 Tax=Dysidea avara TaxID=196820 RepID=UPI00332A700B